MARPAGARPGQQVQRKGAVSLQPAEPESLLHFGRQLLEGQEHVKALKVYSRAVDLWPSHEEACRGKILTLQRLQRPRGALKACMAALSVLPGCPWLLGLQAELAKGLGAEARDLMAEESAGKGAARAGGGREGQSAAETTVGESDDSDAEPPEAAEGEASRGGALEGAGCPASRAASQPQPQPQPQLALEAEAGSMASEASAVYRSTRKAELVSFYRDFYCRTRSKSVDTSQYTKAEKKGLSIKDGHRHMPRPERVVLPPDFRESVGTLSPATLSMYNSMSGRMLLCVHGDLFDVSDRPDKYGPDGPYHSMPGHDITWALWAGYDEEGEWDKYFDLQQAEPREERDRRFQGLMSWWAFFEQEYGSPVGRLDVYDAEWALPPPPAVRELCTVM